MNRLRSLFSATSALSSAPAALRLSLCGARAGVDRMRRCSAIWCLLVILAALFVPSCFAAAPRRPDTLAPLPPMGWNDWAHYQCDYTAQTILENAQALVRTGLAAHGYNTVTIDDCWMQKDRDPRGNLQPDPQRFPRGMKAVADAVHGLGLKFGIYEDAGGETCGGFAGSGEPKGGGSDHFLEDARLFASWGVDYLKLDGCNVYVPQGGSQIAAYRKAYAAEAEALKTVGRPTVFSESAPAYFQGTPDWYDVLTWVRYYGQLWREGSDIATFDPAKPDADRFDSVLWNYAYNLPLGRFQKPGNWNDADFIIAGDDGMTLPETRSQLALWSMMSAPLILSSDLDKLTPQAIAILSNGAVISVDQDPLGREATLVRRSPQIDVLLKPLKDGEYAVAVLNRDSRAVRLELPPAEFGFAENGGCRLDARDLWTGDRQSAVSTLRADVAAHDTEIWRVHAGSSCGVPRRTGVIVLTANETTHDHGFDHYTRCLSNSGSVEACEGTPAETWTFTAGHALQSAGNCLTVAAGKPVMQSCTGSKAQQWNYTLSGNLVSTDQQCLSSNGSEMTRQSLELEACGHNRPDQTWSLPN